MKEDCARVIREDYHECVNKDRPAAFEVKREGSKSRSDYLRFIGDQGFLSAMS